MLSYKYSQVTFKDFTNDKIRGQTGKSSLLKNIQKVEAANKADVNFNQLQSKQGNSQQLSNLNISPIIPHDEDNSSAFLNVGDQQQQSANQLAPSNQQHWAVWESLKLDMKVDQNFSVKINVEFLPPELQKRVFLLTNLMKGKGKTFTWN